MTRKTPAPAARKKTRLTAEARAKVFKALSDERRVDIVDSLARNGSQCGTQLAEELDISLALLCHHWEVLVDAGIVRKERVGQLRVCTLDSERLREATGSWDPLPAKKPAKKKAATKPRSDR
jgi:DNA-binding transcriptional ArsR family regulator